MEEKEIYRKGYLLCFVALVFIILSSTTAFGAVIRVPGDHSTIQAGIDAASNGDTVSVADGTYVGLGNKDLDFNGKAITVKSDNGPENCVIDCEGNGRGFYFHSGETQSSILSGFTITNGQADYGGGIACSSSPTIINCRIIGNTAESSGGGIFFSYGCIIKNCIIAGNTAVYGGGIGIVDTPNTTKLTNCTITGNMDNHGSVLNISNSYVIFTNCILWGGQLSGNLNKIPEFNYCDIEDDRFINSTIIHLPPLFVDVSDPSPIKWDLHLLSSSPCIDSGTSEGAPNYDIDGNSRPQGSAYDIGAYEYGGTSPLDANFSATPTSGAAPLTVNFTDLSKGTVNSWNWSFGDNSTSNDQAPSHTYNDPGSYTVTLTVSGPESSDAETKPDYIKVTYPSEVKAMPWIPLLLLDDGGGGEDTIQNGNFESGSTAWTEYSTGGIDIIRTSFPGTVDPHSGSYAAWLGGVYDATRYIRQTVAVPSSSPTLTFYHWIASAESGCNYDLAYVRVNGSNKDTLGLCSSNNTGGWVPRSINLSGYVGQNISLEFRSVTNSSLNSNWFIDDVSFQ